VGEGRYIVIRLPWRGHAHVRVCARLPEDHWADLFDAVADAAHELDEQVTCSGTGNPDWGIYTVDVQAFRLRQRAVDALADRCRAAAAGLSPKAILVHVDRNGRCGGFR
jgi:hypothetical protein